MYSIYHDESSLAQNIAKVVLKRLTDSGKKCEIISKLVSNTKGDIISIGDDRHFLTTFIGLNKSNIFCIGTGGTVLSDVTPENFNKYLGYLLEDRWFIQEKSRITVSDHQINALNDVLIVPSKSATLIRYSLEIDSHEIWVDTSDGIILCTPTGSTAYNLSAGGNAMIGEPCVIGITPLNSIKRQDPIIVPDKSRVGIRLLSGHAGILAIYDGVVRRPLKSDLIEIVKAPPAKFIRCKHDIHVFTQITKASDSMLKTKTKGMPPSKKFIYRMLTTTGAMTQKELINLTSLPPRTVRDALLAMEKQRIIEKTPYTRDIRQSVYRISVE